MLVINVVGKIALVVVRTTCVVNAQHNFCSKTIYAQNALPIVIHVLIRSVVWHVLRDIIYLRTNVQLVQCPNARLAIQPLRNVINV